MPAPLEVFWAGLRGAGTVARGWLAESLLEISAGRRERQAGFQEREQHPRRGYQDQRIRKERAELAFRAVRLGGDVPVRVVDRQQVRFRRLVEGVDEKL